MEIKKPRRPAIIEPETLEYLEGEEARAVQRISAHLGANPDPCQSWGMVRPRP